MGWFSRSLSDSLDEAILDVAVDDLSRFQPDSELEPSDSTFLKSHPDFLSFSTGNATYHLHPGDELHNWEVSTIVQDVDAVVLETGPYRSYDLDLLAEQNQYDKILQASLEQKDTPIYLVDSQGDDTDIEDREEALELIEEEHSWSDLLTDFDVAGALYSIIRKNFKFKPFALSFLASGMDFLGSKGYFKTPNSYLKLRNFYKKKGGRSAVAAEKMDDFIAPKTAQENGEKPHIFIEYGADHLDMKHYLENEQLRDNVTALHDLINKVRNDGEYRDKVGELRFSDFEDGPVNTYHHDGEQQPYQKIIYELDELKA